MGITEINGYTLFLGPCSFSKKQTKSRSCSKCWCVENSPHCLSHKRPHYLQYSSFFKTSITLTLRLKIVQVWWFKNYSTQLLNTSALFYKYGRNLSQAKKKKSNDLIIKCEVSSPGLTENKANTAVNYCYSPKVLSNINNSNSGFILKLTHLKKKCN